MVRIFLGNAPSQFALGRECRMQDAGDFQSRVRWTQFDLTDQSIRAHVADGMRLTHLAIDYDNVMSFVLDEDATLTKIKLLGMDEKADDANDALAQLDAEFVLLSGIVRQLITDLEKQLGAIL